MHKELERGWSLFHEGKIEEVLQLLLNFEKLEDLTPKDKHYYRFLKGVILINMGRFQESLKIADHDYQENKNQNKSLFLIDSIFIKWASLYLSVNLEVWQDVVFCEQLLKSEIKEPSSEIELRKGFFYFMKGYLLKEEEDFDKVIELHKKSLIIAEKYDIAFFMLPMIFNLLGQTYTNKGELDLGLEYHKKCLDFPKGSNLINDMVNGSTINHIGEIYFQKGVLDQAIEYYKKSLKIFEQFTLAVAVNWVAINYYSMIRAFLYKNSPEEAQEHFDRFSQYIEKKKIPINYYWYRLSKARLLRSSSRVRDRAEAEKTLKEIIEEQKAAKKKLNRGVTDESTIALIELCDFYLEELRLTNDLKIINDIQPLIIRLLKESERTNSYTLQSQTYLLQGKVSLLQLNMGDARLHLIKAQRIAEEHSLKLLAREISTEHDKLLTQLDKWEEFNKTNAPISERMSLASLKESVELMQKRREIKVPELINEDPVLLLIIGIGGILLFSYPFSDDIKIDDELFGGFLSAITSFSDEVFSEGLDRAKFGQYTILMKNIADFSFCYIFKGQTYLAQKKFSDFIEDFHKSDSMMQTLDKFNQTSQVIELKDFPFFEGFIKRIFINR
jgi:tetratricopeptide (TPR) repeat protein